MKIILLNHLITGKDNEMPSALISVHSSMEVMQFAAIFQVHRSKMNYHFRAAISHDLINSTPMKIFSAAER